MLMSSMSSAQTKGGEDNKTPTHLWEWLMLIDGRPLGEKGADER